MPSRSSCSHTMRPRRVPTSAPMASSQVCPSSTDPFDDEPDPPSADVERPARELGITEADNDAVGDLAACPSEHPARRMHLSIR